MTHYRLHHFPESGNSYKLALMLTLCGRKFEPVWTDFGARVTWTRRMVIYRLLRTFTEHSNPDVLSFLRKRVNGQRIPSPLFADK
jgi:hypothetical protein